MVSVGAVSPPEVILCCSRAGKQSFEIDSVEQQNFPVREAYSFLFLSVLFIFKSSWSEKLNLNREYFIAALCCAYNKRIHVQGSSSGYPHMDHDTSQSPLIP